MVKNLPANAEDTEDLGSIPGLGRSPRERNRNAVQYYCVENPMNSGAWWAAVHGVSESDMTEHARTLVIHILSLAVFPQIMKHSHHFPAAK